MILKLRRGALCAVFRECAGSFTQWGGRRLLRRAGLALSLLAPLVIASAPAQAEAVPPNDIELGFHSMYNLDFAKAHAYFSKWEQQHPTDPMGPVSQATAYLFSEFNRLGVLEAELFTDDSRFDARQKLTPDPKVREEFNGALDQADKLAGGAAGQDNNNFLFSQVMALGLRSDYAALIEKRDFAAMRYMKEARELAEKLLLQDPKAYDAYIAVGVENYLSGIRPAPVRWLLQMGGVETDKNKGIQELQEAAAHGDLLKPYAKLLLAVASLRDNNTAEGCGLLNQLATTYPRNPLYRQNGAHCPAP